ncbi:MATE family efflux transporter [Actinoplanes sp. NPDC026623]|uniref:MATE family efflux transporter n=1 Tax=Actinoplanes sp. NPDC026623 TaxID=3155610 RepID=UPI0033CD0FF9
MAIGGVFGVGGGALISRLLGAAERDPAKAGEIRHVSSFAVWGSVAAGAVFGAAGLLALDPLVSLLGADAATTTATHAYVGVMLAFVPVLAAAFCLEQLVRAEGAARQVMIGLIASTVANVVLDVLFILVLHRGVAGAALAMGLSSLGVVAYFVTWLQRHSAHVSLAPRWFTLSPGVLKPVLGVGVGELFQAAFLIVTSLVLNNLAVGYGDDALAAMGVAVRIAQVPEFLVMGITIGVLPLLAYCYGKGDRDRLMAALRACAVTVGGIVMVFSTTVFRPRGAGDRDVPGAGGPVHPDRDPRQPVVGAARRHLGADRHRGHRVRRRRRDVAGLAPRHRPRPRRGQPRTRRAGPGAGRGLTQAGYFGSMTFVASSTISSAPSTSRYAMKML